MRKTARITGAAVLAAVLITGCSKSEGSGKPDDKATPSASSGPASSGAAAGGIEGAFLARAKDGPVALAISEKKAVLTAAGHTCTGEYTHDTLMLTCADGNTDRVMGMVKASNGGNTLTVDWDTLADDDVFTKASTSAGLPSGFPSLLAS